MFLTDEEFRRLGRVLNEAAVVSGVLVHAAAAIRLFMLSGCRKSVILTSRWEDVDLGYSDSAFRAQGDIQIYDVSPWLHRVPGG